MAAGDKDIFKRANGFDKNPENINRGGRPKGSKNRSTIAKQILEMTVKYPTKVLSQLQKIYPEIQDQMSIEEAMTIVQANKAIMKQDTAAYRALMDTAYGMPKQDVAINDVESIDISYEDATDED